MICNDDLCITFQIENLGCYSQAGNITAGKPFLLRTKFGDPKYACLDQLWSSADAYLDLAASAADATKFLRPKRSRSGKVVLVTVQCSGASAVVK